MINDASRAFFEAPMQEGRHLCIELPDEDLSPADRKRDVVGHLQQRLYGTRDAAANGGGEMHAEVRFRGWKVQPVHVPPSRTRDDLLGTRG